MFVVLDNKLYIQKEDKLVGVDYSLSDGIKEITGTECDLSTPYLPIEPFEVKSMFNVTIDSPYKFPIPKVEKEIVKEVVKPTKVEVKPKK